ncbi:mobile mystery protein A [Candidatus Poriferisodalis sp.]|uniref:mobile mystery protein A n=1 Tax=Candidatus Poriferisodalis sp. TaxID=3101277 RepID=UPI003B02C476
MRNQRAIARRRLDERLARVVDITRPAKGWIRALRDALGMTSADLAQRMGVSPQRVYAIERSEQHMTLKLSTLERIAHAMDCDLVYALVPRTSLENCVTTQAGRRAAEHLRSVAHHARLEDQVPTERDLAQQIEELASDLVERKGLWTEDRSR